MRSRLRNLGTNQGAQLSSAGGFQCRGLGSKVILLDGAQHLPRDYCVSTFPSRGDPASIFWREPVDLAFPSRLGL